MDGLSYFAGLVLASATAIVLDLIGWNVAHLMPFFVVGCGVGWVFSKDWRL